VVPVHTRSWCILHTQVFQPNRELQILRAHKKDKGKGKSQEDVKGGEDREERREERRGEKQNHLLACWFLVCLIL
jgi:hypothetical protein